MMKMKINVLSVIMLIMLLSSCGDHFSKITQDPKFVDPDQDGRPTFDSDAITKGVDGMDPCITSEYNWEQLGFTCKSLEIERKQYPGTLFCQKWTRVVTKEEEEDKGALFIVPGRTEYTEMYHHMIGEIGKAQEGKRQFDIVICDHAGQGRSKGGVGGDGNLEMFLSDLTVEITTFGKRNSNNAVIGHSMGGAISTAYMYHQVGIRNKVAKMLKAPVEMIPEVKTFVFSAPMYVINTFDVPYKHAVMLASSKLASNSGDSRFPLRSKKEEIESKMGSRSFADNPYADDPSILGKFAGSQLVEVGDPTYRWLYMALYEIPGTVFLKASDFYKGTPFMLIHSDKDSVVNSKSFNEFILPEWLKKGIITKDEYEQAKASGKSATSLYCSLIINKANGTKPCTYEENSVDKHNVFMNSNKVDIMSTAMNFIYEQIK